MLIDANAEQLLELHARRWEQELFDKELKLQVNQGILLAGQQPRRRRSRWLP